jgi:hypothetical protein
MDSADPDTQHWLSCVKSYPLGSALFVLFQGNNHKRLYPDPH